MSATRGSFNRPSRRKPLAVCVAVILGLSAASAVHASTFFVTNCDDSGPNAGTLRLAANNAVNGDVIDMTGVSALAPGCFGASDGFDAFMLVGSTVSIAGGVTINGPGKNAFAVSAIGSGQRVFSSPGALTINDLGVKYGNIYNAGSTTKGGCIYAHNDLNLTNVRTFSCSAVSNTAPARGGAVYSFLGAVNATGSNFMNSYAQSTSGGARGGAVYGFTNVYLNNSLVSCHNYAGGSCTYAHATTSTGTAGAGVGAVAGGAVHAHTGHVVATNGSTLFGNAYVTGAAGGTAYGGSVYAKTYATITDHSVVVGNAATQSTAAAKGGGIFAGTNTNLEGTSAVFISSVNSAGYTAQGGGIFTSTGEATIKYSAVEINSAHRGGGVYSQGGVWAKYSLIFGNFASGGGGGIITTVGNSTIQGSTIYANSGKGWNGLDHITGGSSSVTIKNSTISANSTSTGVNPAGYIKAFSTTIDNSTIVYNSGHGTAASDAGLRVRAGDAGSTLDLNSTLISSNTNDSGNNDLFVDGGGAVVFTGSSGHNLVRNPGGGVPADTIVGQCPVLHRLAGTGFIYNYRPSMKTPEIDTGSNPLNLTSDQRGNANGATFPPRASGPGPANPTPIPDIGSYEVDQDDIIFDSIFEGCD